MNQLELDNMVYLAISGVGHYSVIASITNTTVYLADSDLGNINMTMADFMVEYSGYALVITNGTNNTQFDNSTILTNGEMQNIKGGCVCPPKLAGNTQNIINKLYTAGCIEDDLGEMALNAIIVVEGWGLLLQVLLLQN